MITVENFIKQDHEIDIDSYSWESVSGKDALMPIERHARTATHSGELMEKWLSANKSKALPHQNCKTHGQAKPNVWACPECLVLLREENKTLSARVEKLQRYAQHAQKVISLQTITMQSAVIAENRSEK